VFVHWEFSTGSFVLCPATFLWDSFSVPPAPSTVLARLQFPLCSSVLWGSLVLDAALWLRGLALWSTTFPCFGEWLIASFQPLLPFLCLFTDSLALSLGPCPSPFLWFSFSVWPAPSTVWFHFAVCYSVLLGDHSSRDCAGLCSPGWIGDSCIMFGAHLFFCQLTCRQVWCQQWQQWEMVPNFLSVTWCGNLSTGRGSWCWKFDSGCCFICTWWRKVKRRKEKKRKRK
jgi:hypothetical protein